MTEKYKDGCEVVKTFNTNFLEEIGVSFSDYELEKVCKMRDDWYKKEKKEFEEDKHKLGLGDGFGTDGSILQDNAPYDPSREEFFETEQTRLTEEEVKSLVAHFNALKNAHPEISMKQIYKQVIKQMDKEFIDSFVKVPTAKEAEDFVEGERKEIARERYEQEKSGPIVKPEDYAPPVLVEE